MHINNPNIVSTQSALVIVVKMSEHVRATWLSLLCLLLAAILTPVGEARAEILSFGNFSQFEINQNDSGAAPVLSIANDRILLTNAGSTLQARSIFHKSPQPIADRFKATFSYRRNTSPDPTFGAGVMFVIQNSPDGFDALGESVASNLGYGGSASGISDSLAFSLELDNGSRSGLYMNGNKGLSRGALVTPVDFALGNLVRVQIEYDGAGVLTQTITDTVTNAAFSADYLMDIPAVVGGDAAFVGFTGSTGLDIFTGARDQYISDFTFEAVPEPASITLLATGAAMFLGMGCFQRRRKMCPRDGGAPKTSIRSLTDQS